MVAGLFVRCAGRGPRVVLLHGGVLAGDLCWSRQLRLADRFALEIVDRAGYGRSQEVSPGEDLEDLLAGPPAGGVRPGWSSSDGGSEELPEFRDAARSSLASRSSGSPARPASAAFCAASMAMSWPCSAISASRATSSGLAVTDHHHPGIPFAIKPARWAGHQKSSPAATRIRTTGIELPGSVPVSSQRGGRRRARPDLADPKTRRGEWF